MKNIEEIVKRLRVANIGYPQYQLYISIAITLLYYDKKSVDFVKEYLKVEMKLADKYENPQMAKKGLALVLKLIDDDNNRLLAPEWFDKYEENNKDWGELVFF